jgi:alpha-glucosidase
MDQPEVHDSIAAMRRVAKEFGDRLLIGEAYLPIDRLMAYYGVDLSGFQLPFNFHLISSAWNPQAVGALIERYEAALPAGGWPNWVLGNHDRSRVASRLGEAQARLAAMLLLTLRGTPTIYQGEELGMRDVAIPPEQVSDPWEKNVPGLGLGRDPVRTPMRWLDAQHGGFTNGSPWLPIGETAGAASQAIDPSSFLALYRALLRLRAEEHALSIGSYRELARTDAVLAYAREYQGRRLYVALNFTPAEQPLPRFVHSGRALLSTRRNDVGGHAPVALQPHEGLILEPLP